jgi:hypothetical protein
LSGYNPKILKDDSLEDQQPIAHLGLAVLVGATVAGANWAIAGLTFAGNIGVSAAIATAIAAGILGASIVIVLDRAAIYFLDAHAGRSLACTVFVSFRIGMILLISSITASAVSPFYLKYELIEEALHMREASRANRVHNLAAQQDLPGLQSAITQAENEAVDARQAIAVVPAEVKQRFDLARACRSDLARRRAQLLAQNIEPAEATRQLAVIAGRCSQQQAEGKALLAAHVERARAAAGEAEDKLRQAQAAFENSNADLKARSADAETIEKTAINPLSAKVLQSLLSHSAGARYKFWTVCAAIMALELLPLLTKLMAPRSVPGTRIATNYAIVVARYDRRQRTAIEEMQVEDALRSAMSSAMLEALAGPEVCAQITRLFEKKIAALVPINVFRALMREIESNEFDVAVAAQQFPSCAVLITEMWRLTVEEVIVLLHGMQPRAAFGATIRSAA